MTKTVKLAEGVSLHLLQNEKFKTIHIMVRFRTLISQEISAKRALLANLLTLANAKYPNPRDFQTALAMNFGMRLGAGVTSKGLQHNLTFGMNVVEPRFVGEDTLKTAADFLHDVIHGPLLSDDGKSFDAQLFELVRTNGIHDLEVLKDDNAYMAAVKLEELYFTDENMFTTPDSMIEQFKQIDAAQLYDYYQTMLAGDAIDLFLLGNVTEAELAENFENWKFADRSALTEENEIFYSQSVFNDEKNVSESKTAYQSQLAMAWEMPVQYGDRDYLALQVFNGLFGGQPNSKLFSIVREKESLAYGISSRFDSFTGMVTVTAGVDAENLEVARNLTLSLLEELKNGNFSATDLAQTKALLRNGFLAGNDSASGMLELAFVTNLLPERALSDEEWLAALEAVSAEEVQRVAQRLVLQATYLLEAQP